MATPSPDAAAIAAYYALGLERDRLVARGYRAHLVDPVPRHVEQARAAIGARDDDALRAEVGDARDVRLADASVDAVLLLGPLYHSVLLDASAALEGEPSLLGASAHLLAVARRA